MTAQQVPAGARPAGVDSSWQLPRPLRPPARDLPALAWLAARRFGQHPDGRPVGRYPAAAALPLWLVLLLVQQATGTLAARGRDAILVVAPTWLAARRPYRIRKAAAVTATAGGAAMLAVLCWVVVYGIGAAGFAAGVPSPVLVLGEAATGLVALLAWLVGLAVHPLRRELAREVQRWATTGRDAAAPRDRTALVSSLCGRGRPTVAAAGGGAGGGPPGGDAAAPRDRTALVSSLCGRGRPSVAAGRLIREVLEHADARG